MEMVQRFYVKYLNLPLSDSKLTNTAATNTPGNEYFRMLKFRLASGRSTLGEG